MIEIKSNFTGWHKVNKAQAKKYVLYLLHSITTMTMNEKIKYIEKEKIRGVAIEGLGL